ncbi:hypothetical protein KCP74_02240 [Salmonella enterica subsp. enterica]|nr:hypothetical protein KCP74_02240 [Salmonella enterica subsp. enterica]
MRIKLAAGLKFVARLFSASEVETRGGMGDLHTEKAALMKIIAGKV